MKMHIYKIGSIFCMVTVLSFLLSPICEARTSDKPVVIRKKITESSEQNQKTTLPEPKVDISITNNDAVDEKNAEANTAYADGHGSLYDPAGKIDPFEPLFRETPKVQSQKATYADTDRKQITALEKIDLSQLKLTGIILAASGNKALVQETSGKGHVISIGTRIGTHGGHVAEVLKNRIIVKEKMKDVIGRLFFQKTEMKLNKTNG